MRLVNDKKKKKPGRPKKYHLDPNEVEKLAGYGCTNGEISDFFGCSETTLTRNYGVNLVKGRTSIKIKLRKLQIRACENGNVTMMIWLGKQLLGQSEKKESEWSHNITGVEFIDIQ